METSQDERWSFKPEILFEGSSLRAVLLQCSKKTQAFWKKVAFKKNGLFHVKKTAFVGDESERLPDDFVDAWWTLVMGTDGCQSVSLGRAVISNHHLRKLARKYRKESAK